MEDALYNAKNLTTPPEEKEQKPEKEPEYYGPGGNPDGSGQGQAQQRPPTSPTPPVTQIPLVEQLMHKHF